MEFRQLMKSDLSACAKVFIEVFNDEPWNDQWSFEQAVNYLRQQYQTPFFLGVLAIEKEEIIGFIYGNKRIWWEGNEFYIHEFGVKKQWRGQGVGAALLDSLEKSVPEDVTSFSLLTDRGTDAEVFYQNKGFRQIDRLVFYHKSK
ncbi:GNAT family N-acetyltransferase [Enterococcus saccharolyticus]|uniref:GNAT family N-acetyltransferase n=1 Tax=Enterococcus saccharolyticus TaxID=41997 RepID=UPI001E5EDA22|nr:GNAT family N-acetyltransferase [Enterococcus saccharolyticus]MCD5002146.1 GNAT family N-acetyltransferase [Enterococcus saccharolyticus]